MRINNSLIYADISTQILLYFFVFLNYMKVKEDKHFGFSFFLFNEMKRKYKKSDKVSIFKINEFEIEIYWKIMVNFLFFSSDTRVKHVQK